MMHSLDEVGLIPVELSDIKHRADVIPFVQSPFGGNKLPVFVSPMTCILNANNICKFSQSLFEPILPVAGDYESRIQLPNGSNWQGWTAMTLDEFKLYFNGCEAPEDRYHYILIDVANGHMKELYDCVRDAKQEYGDYLKVMIGNIANPETYIECCKARVDYVRVGIGGGSGCKTSVQTGIHASMLHILKGIEEAKNHIHNYECSAEIGMRIYRCPEIAAINGFRTKVIADGGIDTIGKAIKCLALGADYVMMGKCFAECEEACGPTQEFLNVESNFGNSYIKKRWYYGQASVKGQQDRFGKVKTEPEGIDLLVDVDTDLSTFAKKFEAALRSAMSYCGAHNLDEFIGKVQYEIMSPSEFNSFNK